MTTAPDAMRDINRRQKAARRRVSAGLTLNSGSGWPKVYAEGHCRMCLRPHRVRPLTRHHLVPQGWFKAQDVDVRILMNAHANIVGLCRACHDLVEDDQDARRLLRKCLTQTEIAFIVQMMGLAWLNVVYPRAA